MDAARAEEEVIMEQEHEAAGPSSETAAQRTLQNNVILRNIFEELSYTAEDLKTFRLVCSTWNKEMSTRWKRLTLPVKLRHEDEQESGNEATSGTSSTTDSDTLENFLSQKEQKAHHYFILEGWTMNDVHLTPSLDGNEKDDLQYRFWKSNGNHIINLVLESCLIPFSHTLLTESLWAALPNLERLAIKNCKFDYGDDHLEFVERDEEDRLTRENRFRSLLRQRLDLVKARHGEWTTPSAPSHLKLKSLWLENITAKKDYQTIIHWESLTTMFPNMKRLELWQLSCMERIGQLENVQSLDTLTLMDRSVNCFGLSSFYMVQVKWKDLHLQSLALSCNYASTLANEALCAVTSQRKTLKRLVLYRMPHYCETLPSLPCNELMPNLVELDLSGNVSRNLDFLRFMPNLKIFNWNTKCFGNQKNFETLLTWQPTRNVYLQNSDKIIENTTKLDDDFKLNNVQILALDWGPKGSACWERVGKWMPNVKNLKCVVYGDALLALIAKQWPLLEDLEMAHGSSATANGIRNVLLTERAFQNFCNFTWKPCACLNEAFEGEKSFDKEELKSLPGVNVILPWTQDPLADHDGEQSVCFKGLFQSKVMEKARNGG